MNLDIKYNSREHILTAEYLVLKSACFPCIRNTCDVPCEKRALKPSAESDQGHQCPLTTSLDMVELRTANTLIRLNWDLFVIIW